MKFEPSLRNILENDGIAVSVTGMVIVFMGLILVSLFIAWLPALLEFHDRLRNRGNGEAAQVEEDESVNEAEIAVAIAMVLEHAMTPEDGSAFQRITIRRGTTESVWKHAGYLSSMTGRIPPTSNQQ